jgi:hypothetical protein
MPPSSFQKASTEKMRLCDVVVLIVMVLKYHREMKVQAFFVSFLLLKRFTYPRPPGLGIFPREEAKKKGQLSPPLGGVFSQLFLRQKRASIAIQKITRASIVEG